MEIQTVSVLLSSRQQPEDVSFTHSIYKTGPDAIPVTEIPVYQHLYGMDSVSAVKPFGRYETSKKDEYDRMKSKFGRKMTGVYPTASVGMPKTIEDLDLEPDQMEIEKPAAKKAPAMAAAD